jgi:hypothetical protein
VEATKQKEENRKKPKLEELISHTIVLQLYHTHVPEALGKPHRKNPTGGSYN